MIPRRWDEDFIAGSNLKNGIIVQSYTWNILYIISNCVYNAVGHRVAFLYVQDLVKSNTPFTEYTIRQIQTLV